MNTTTEIHSYESWLRSQGLFEMANQVNAGDPPGRGIFWQLLRERYRSPYWSDFVEIEFSSGRVGAPVWITGSEP